ncbi:type I restriction-modification system subunit M [Methanomicrobium antiquum]|uniref:site-specific DNA-methyltransferase (adenine-specific) n=1 Tax=Methanomicrobium antiquum TaxID=487686 RepID=A0AAF0FYU1_9EURY|nr:class I SAM-dependent DNA methyltransferase [Methanomicrobium antiquum]WFN36979.1 type I restriction-modification system subunit M [Methanomicrobium antiquum]
MASESSALVQKLWNYCNVLRDDGVSYGDYVEQLTYLLFLKMADEHKKPPFNKPSTIPDEYSWETLASKDGDDLEIHYRHILENLGKEAGLLGVIFRKSQNKIQDPAKLKRLVDLIGKETWVGLDMDVKGEIYEGLLQKNAEDTKSGAGQYFTPRSLIQAMVEVTQPEPCQTIADPACGTGGFFLAERDYLVKNYKLDREQSVFLKEETFSGTEIVDSAARLCAMNLYLHGIGTDKSPVSVADSLLSEPDDHYDLILTNPPFGKKSSYTVINGDGKAEKDKQTYERDDFWATTSNKQLNFLQHVRSMLKINGKAAVVVPDNVLFEGGAGEAIRRKLLAECDVHTLLRLPTGIFYAQGVKANVIFFERKAGREEPWTDTLWIYDLRTNIHFTLKENPLSLEDLKDFIKSYNPKNRHERKETERFKPFRYEDLIKRDKVSLDIFWIKDESLEDTENLPEPDILAGEIAESLQTAIEQFSGIYEDLSE